MSKTTTNKDKAKADRRLRKQLAAYRRQHTLCMICGRRLTASVHHIRGGAIKHLTEANPAFFLAVCDGLSGCHAKIQNDPEWPVARVLAHKLVHDPKEFDLLEYNRVTKGVDMPVEMKEVDFYLDEMEG